MTNIDTRSVRPRPTDRTLDHVVPVSRGGRKHDNVIDVCFECNQLKSDRPLLEFLLQHKLMRRTDVGRLRVEAEPPRRPVRAVATSARAAFDCREIVRPIVCARCERSWHNDAHGVEALWSHECHPKEIT